MRLYEPGQNPPSLPGRQACRRREARRKFKRLRHQTIDIDMLLN
jgi:hypothetical protein